MNLKSFLVVLMFFCLDRFLIFAGALCFADVLESECVLQEKMEMER